MPDKIFVEGLIYKGPRDKAPDFVLGSLSVKVDEFIAFLRKNQKSEWVNIDVLRSKAGKPYLALSTWEPTRDKTKYARPERTSEYQSAILQEEEKDIDISDIPF